MPRCCRRRKLDQCALSIVDGLLVSCSDLPVYDLSGYVILPKIIDLHSNGFERHLSPRRGAVKDLQSGFHAMYAEFATIDITTAVLAQFLSWEGGIRGPDFAARFLEKLVVFAPKVLTTLLSHIKFETHMFEHYTQFAALGRRYAVPYVLFNQHLPHMALVAGKTPQMLTGQALKSGHSPAEHHSFLKRCVRLHRKFWAHCGS